VKAEEAMRARPQAARVTDWLASAFLVALMAVGSFALWLGVPVACLALTSKMATSSADQFLLDLPLTVVAMMAWGGFLVWLNHLYLRVTGVIARYRAEEEEFGPGAGPRFIRGPLEPLLVGSLVIALIALVVWFLVGAQSSTPSISVAP
jgi:hypothetical protein